MFKRNTIALWFVLFCICVACTASVSASELRDLFKQVNPAVVTIHTEGKHLEGGGLVSIVGLGSGCLIDRQRVLTAAHVVQTADKVAVEFPSGEVIIARVVASEPSADIALLKLQKEPANITPVPLGDSDLAETGDDVFVVGSPYGIGHTLTVGYISGRHTPGDAYSGLFATELLQTDAAINQGNSGGPMFNMSGEVIGVVSHIVTQSGGWEGLGFVVTSNMVKRLLLEQPGFWSGMQGHVLQGELADLLNLPTPGVGLLVETVAEGSPAAKLGLRGGTVPAVIAGMSINLGGDIIIEAMDTPISEGKIIQNKLRNLRAGVTLRVKILRGGKPMNLVYQIMPEDM